MASRIFGLSAETVRAYNMIHLVFSSDKRLEKNGANTTALFALKIPMVSIWLFASANSSNY